MKKILCIFMLLTAVFAGLWAASGAFAATNTLVVKGSYDNIEDILDSLGWTYTTVNELSSGTNLTNFDQIYVNCGTDSAYDENAVAKVKAWVEAGGSLYVSDLAYPFVEPWGIKFNPNGEGDQTVSAAIEDTGLRAYLKKSTIDIFFDLSAWAVITDPRQSSVLLRAGSVQGQGTNSPLAVTFNAGKGRVIFTTFHNHPAGTAIDPDVKKTVEYFAATPKKDTEVSKLLDEYGVSLENLVSSSLLSFAEVRSQGIYVDSPADGTKGTYFFRITDTFLTADASKMAETLTVAAKANGSCTVGLYKPDGSLYKSIAMDSSSTAVNVPAADNAKGTWSFKVQNSSGYSDDTMVIAASTRNTEVGGVPDPLPGPVPDPGKNGGSSGGCNAGSGALIVAAIAATARILGKRAR